MDITGEIVDDKKESESRVEERQTRNTKEKKKERRRRWRRWRGDWCPKLWLFEGMTQPLIQVFKYLMQGGIKQDRLTTELSVKTRIY